MSKSEEKQIQVTVKILEVLNELINEDDTINKMVHEDFTSFIHVLSNCVPTIVFNKMMGEDMDLLQVNHIANRLCFQNMNKITDQ